jgi:hypothetical protein
MNSNLNAWKYTSRLILMADQHLDKFKSKVTHRFNSGFMQVLKLICLHEGEVHIAFKYGSGEFSTDGSFLLTMQIVAE